MLGLDLVLLAISPGSDSLGCAGALVQSLGQELLSVTMVPAEGTCLSDELGVDLERPWFQLRASASVVELKTSLEECQLGQVFG